MKTAPIGALASVYINAYSIYTVYVMYELYIFSIFRSRRVSPMKRYYAYKTFKKPTFSM